MSTIMLAKNNTDNKPYSDPILDCLLSGDVHGIDAKEKGTQAFVRNIVKENGLPKPDSEKAKLLTRILKNPPKLPNNKDHESMVQNIAVVGALFDEKHNFYDRDRKIISSALQLLKEAEVSIAQNLKFHFYNLLPPLSSDFLRSAIVNKSSPQSDVVISCGILGAKRSDLGVDMLRPFQRVALKDFSYEETYGEWDRYNIHNSRMTTVSMLQACTETWAMASDNVGAKFVITDGNDDDATFVNTNHFLFRDYYEAVIPTSEKYARGQNGHYGILVRNANIPEIKAGICPKSHLGQRIHALG